MARNLIEAITAQIEDQYSRVENPEAHEWPRAFVEAVKFVSEMKSRSQGRMVAILVRCLMTLEASRREVLINEMGVSSQILGLMQSPPDWPETLPVIGYDDADKEDLERIRNRALSRINDDADRAAMMILKPGVRYALTVVQKQLEVARYRATDTHEEGDYPHLEAEVGITAPDLPNVVKAIEGQIKMWSSVNGQIEKHRMVASVTVAAIENVEDIDGVVSQAKEDMMDAVQPILAFMAGPEPEEGTT